jgi:hypothetical protein
MNLTLIRNKSGANMQLMRANVTATNIPGATTKIVAIGLQQCVTLAMQMIQEVNQSRK